MYSHTFTPGHFSAPLLSILVVLAMTTNPASPATTTTVMDNYNQACLSSLAGQTDVALKYFKNALTAGFDDFRFAMADSELTNLINTPAFASLYTTHQSQQTLLSSERGLNLSSNIWSDWQELFSKTNSTKSKASFRIQWQPQALILEILLSGEMAALFAKPIQPPWYGGPGVMLSLAIPDGTSPFESANTFQFGFGKSKTSGTGAIYLGRQLGWQPVGELTPAISLRDQGQTAVISASISWQSILPFHPLVDSPLGLNLSIRGEKTEDLFTLFPDPAAFLPAAKVHRYVPLNFDAASESRESFAGRLNQSLLVDQPLICDLKIVSAQSGTGRLKIDFLDQQGNSVLPEGAARSNFPCQPGVNSVSRTADFRALAMGPYLVKVELELPSGEGLVWSSQVLNLGPNWREALQEQVEKLTPQDQPTTQYYLDTIVEAVENLAPRRHPGQVATTLQMLNSLLKAGIEEGSILPESGLMQLVWQDPRGRKHLCSVYLPRGFSKAKNREAIVLLTDAYGAESRLVGRIARLYEHQDGPVVNLEPSRQNFPVYLIPHWKPGLSQTLAEKNSELVAFNQWAEEYFQFSAMALAGVDGAAGLALHFSNQAPTAISRLLIFAGANLNPWPEADHQELVDIFSGQIHHQFHTTWIDFTQETRTSGQGQMLLSILKESKYIMAVKEVRGGLSMTQVTDRLVLWVEENPK